MTEPSDSRRELTRPDPQIHQQQIEPSLVASRTNAKWLFGCAIWASFLAVSLSAAPIPGINESHYLTKAKHYWNPSWCERDFFLTSFPAHRVFYQAFGWLTFWFDLSTVALLGRMVSSGLLAAGWLALTSRLGVKNSLLPAWLFLGLQALGNFSGEWLIGGFESKVVAFAFVFWSAAAVLDRRLKWAAVWGGVAISFHPIVGLWHVAAIGLATLACVFKSPTATSPANSAVASGIAQPPIFRATDYGLACVLLTLCAWPGLWPAVQMLQAADRNASFAANYIQVFYRLKHHLDPMDFDVASYLGYGALIGGCVAVLLMLRKRSSISSGERWWIGYVLATLFFAIAGCLIGYGPRPAQLMAGFRWRMSLLKFYPFRLFDLMLPVAFSFAVARTLFVSDKTARLDGVHWKRRTVWLLAAVGFACAALKGPLSEPSPPWTHEARADWKEACRWISANTPPDALFVTPIESDSFKWFAQRAEFANFKDCPQDAAGIVEWNRRLKWLHRWGESGFADQRYSVEELRELRRHTTAEFALARRRIPFEADLIYSNNTFNVFRLPGSETVFK